MKGTNVRGFEELVLLKIAALQEESCRICDELATKVRGGRCKQFNQLTIPGKAALVRSRSERDQLWSRIPSLA